jgi:hypothetical protein
MKIENDWWVNGNSLVKSEMQWVVEISPDGIGGWNIRFGKGEKGDGSPWLPMFTRVTIEQCMEIYDKYKDIKFFDDLAKQIEIDQKEEPLY